MRISISPDSRIGELGDQRTCSEDQLIAVARNGQKDLFRELCERHVKKFAYVAHRITRNRGDAEDAVQDCFLNAFVHLKDFDGRSRFSTWLTRIAINAALARLRKRHGIREFDIDETNPPFAVAGQRECPDDAPDPEEIYFRDEQKRIVNAAVSELRPHVRKVVKLRQLREPSIRETAQILGISTGAVKRRMYHGRAALRRIPALKRVGPSNRAA
jgi:RNA polymerase sigma-70 factor (ECF subfamily)